MIKQSGPVLVRAACKAGFLICHCAAVARRYLRQGRADFKEWHVFGIIRATRIDWYQERQDWQHCEPKGNRKASSNLKCEIHSWKLRLVCGHTAGTGRAEWGRGRGDMSLLPVFKTWEVAHTIQNYDYDILIFLSVVGALGLKWRAEFHKKQAAAAMDDHLWITTDIKYTCFTLCCFSVFY